MNAMKDSGKTDAPRTGASAVRAAQRLRRRRVEKQRSLILALLCVGLGAAAATSFKPADALATVRQAYQQVRDVYAQARSLLADEAYARRAAPLRSTPAGMHPPFDSAQTGAHLNTVAAFVGYGPIVLGTGALRERPERQPDLSERAITGRSVPADAERAWVVVALPPAPAAWTGRHAHTVPVRRIELAAFEMSATRRTLDAAQMLKSAESEVWTVPLEAYDAFEAALLNEPFAAHPRRPLLPESSELFVLRQEEESSQTSAMEAAAIDGHGTERADPADAAAQDASSRETSTQDATSAVRVSRSQPQAATSVPDGTFPVPEPLLTKRAENAPAGEPARAADSAAVEGMRVPPDMPRSAPEQSPERAWSSELETPVSERPEFEQPVPEPVDTPRPDAGSPDAPQPDFERPERTQPDTETPHPDMPAVDHTEIARPDIGSPELSQPDVELSEVSVPDIERPERAAELETPDVTRPETARPEIATPDLELPDIELPDVPRAELERPQIDRPAAERPDTAAPDLERPAIELPEIARPDIERPQLDHPTVERPDISRPDIERPAVERPGIELPEVLRPDIERPAMERPDLERPDLERPDLERPDLERPAIERPEVERPDVERPDVERPDLERPDVERPDLERPDIDLPLIERPNL